MDQATNITCPVCGYDPQTRQLKYIAEEIDSEAEFEVLGACDGCLFCPRCGAEFEIESRREHICGEGCLSEKGER